MLNVEWRYYVGAMWKEIVRTNTIDVCADNLAQERFEIRQARTIGRSGQPVSPNHGVELGLRLLLHGGM